MHGDGLMAGIFTFLLIGALHGAVIKGEYYFSKKIWPLFLLGGLGCLALSLFLPDAVWRCLAAVTGFSPPLEHPRALSAGRTGEEGLVSQEPEKDI